jgi:predicted CoA-substrate-specific enzyme activase
MPKSFLGIDIGAASAKAVIIREGDMVARAVMETGPSVERVADSLLKQVLAASGLSAAGLNGVVATGYGRTAVRFADKKVTEITCHARGVNHLMPEARTVIDIGGQDSKAMRIDGQGRVTDFVMNDKCAAGTGRFLEVMARALEVPIDDLGSRSIAGRLNPCLISSLCTVFAESEVVFLRGEGRSPEDIAAGIHVAIAGRVATMISQMGLEEMAVLTGGVALNHGVVRALCDELQVSVRVPEQPQLTGALGAALMAAQLSG